ncbi:MAG: response regulator [Candidatus Marinimicrobia bacterium]|jgi:chemosensory pili system protein ChpA (sensor histidine kinase/response regulator)|nr:response regulator [Candidatus Neomarinimicrobiota bacterium]MBT5760388.1 response regulator [Candidatus Neomarinimicrobiota bacterium]MBT6711358.1 response regulator [Candidatus Neomarinimicrobiota bacterium]MBT6980804.1 response regulator [Candidatus Neomarinimicrobiota bacterium]MBT7373740.1 response regulator [Candidatus Neomarinimicrobiota bacterium]
MSVLKNKSILIVESDDAILNILSSRLKKREMIVITATDGYDGYIRACTESPDFMIIDDLLPSMNGYRLSRMLKFDDRYKDIPILLISTTPENGNNPHQVKTGIDKLLYKPFRFSALISALESMGEK